MLLPLPTVLAVKLPFRQSIVIGLLFGAGFLATAAGAIRTYYTYKVTTSNDKTWDVFLFWVPAEVELYLGLVRFLSFSYFLLPGHSPPKHFVK